MVGVFLKEIELQQVDVFVPVVLIAVVTPLQMGGKRVHGFHVGHFR